MSNNGPKQEIVQLLRNSDVLTTSTRGVTTQTDTATLTAATSTLINRTNVKNIRSLKVGLNTLKYGEDYLIDFDFLDTTIKCKITFNTAQTGELEVTYDYGSDKIFSDQPRDDLKIDSYPRISVEEISKNTDTLSLGGKDFLSSRLFTIIVHSQDQDLIENRLDTIEALIRTNSKSLYYCKFLRPNGRGPLIKSENRSQTIMHKNLDCLVQFEVENA